MDEKLIWLWLSLHFGAGSTLYEKLYTHFGSVGAIFDSDDADVEPLDFLNSSQKRKLLDKNTDHAKEVMEWCDDNGVSVIAFSDVNYPSPLKSLPNFPAVLYCKGTLPDFESDLCIAVVGTRKMTAYGQKNAYELGFGLAKGGAIVVSGMALGIDCTAQKGCLYAGGRTVAVLGSGIDIVYPKENTELFDKIILNGAVITEYAPGTPPAGTNFPVRNRIISGLCRGTVVVEADINSGSMITAKTTINQGRELFAVPGPVRTFTSGGTNQLIRDGAHVVTGAVDIVEQFLDSYPDKIDISGSKMRPVFKKPLKVASYRDMDGFYSGASDAQNGDKNRDYENEVKRGNKILKSGENKCNVNGEDKNRFDPSSLSPNERKLYDSLEYEKPVTIDEMRVDGMDISDISATVTMLEIAGAIEAIPGGLYIKK